MDVPRAPSPNLRISDSCQIVASSGCMIASEPLGSNRQLWREIPRNHIIYVTQDKEVCELYSCEQLVPKKLATPTPHDAK